jgi:type I restriction enzyme M protein
MIRQWIHENISNFNSTIKTEEDLKIKVLLPYLKSLGYSDQEFRFEHGIDVTIGTKKQLFSQTSKLLLMERLSW